jgi:hypothetical protein
MKRGLLIVSICTLLVIGLAVAGQALIGTLEPSYTPSSHPVD